MLTRSGHTHVNRYTCIRRKEESYLLRGLGLHSWEGSRDTSASHVSQTTLSLRKMFFVFSSSAGLLIPQAKAVRDYQKHARVHLFTETKFSLGG